MAYPITYVEELDYNHVLGTGSAYKYVYRSRQARPYNVATTYKKRHGYTIAANSQGGYPLGHLADMGAVKGWWSWGPDVAEAKFASELAVSRNSAYDNFAEKAKGAAAMAAVNVAEFNQALGMITNRAGQLLKFCRALRRFDLKGAASVLGIKKPKSARDSSKDFAALFLEYHFGWEPLIADIGAGIDILQGSVRDKTLHAKGKLVRGEVRTSGENEYSAYTTYTAYRVRTTCSARVRVTNPQLHQADQAGLVNPLSVAWELVPFSFVVDWFVPVSSFLNSMTDFLGLDLDNECYFTLLRTPVWFSEQHTISAPYPYGFDITSTGHVAYRTLGIPSVTLVPNRIYGISPVRAATAISLLLQQGLRGS